MGLFDGIERLKHKIHSTKIPLSKRGQRIMMMVYVTTPVLIGYQIMQWTTGHEQKNRQWQQSRSHVVASSSNSGTSVSSYQHGNSNKQ